jgi:hypothetical protein
MASSLVFANHAMCPRARHFRVEGLEFADLVQEGVVGLPRALLARGNSDRRDEHQ